MSWWLSAMLLRCQDTIVALRALSEFGFRDTNRGLYTMRVTLAVTSSADFQEQVTLSKDNVLDYHQFSIPRVFGSVRASAEGTGYALMQVGTLKSQGTPSCRYAL